MSTECLLPLALLEATDEELELAYAPGLLQYLTSPAPGDAQSPGEAVKDHSFAGEIDRRTPEPASPLNGWLGQILLD